MENTSGPEMDDTRKIIEENRLLSEQVKRLVKTEYALYNTQIELDKQIILYRSLYDMGQKLSSLSKIESIFSEMRNFIINEFNYGGYLLFERKGNSFALLHCGGCCKKEKSYRPDRISEIMELIKDDGGNCIATEKTEESDLLRQARESFGFSEFVMHPLHVRRNKPLYILIVGNPPNHEYYNRIVPNDITMIGLGNLVSLITNALNNAIHYQQLVEERKLLEKKVGERTNDLNQVLEELKKTNKKLNNISLRDELTGLYNRRGFFAVGEQHFEMSRRKGSNLLILFTDLDKLKTINDVYGHKEGDSALKHTAAIFKKAFRNSDIISRFGGDEFVMLLDNTTEDYLDALKGRLDELFLEFNNKSKKEYNISVSYGYSSYITGNRISFEELIEKADKRLMEEKRKKGGR